MKIVNVDSNIKPYRILLGNGIRYDISDYLQPQYSSILLISDTNVADLYADDIMQGLQGYDSVYLEVVHAGEQSKSVDIYYELLTKAIELGLDRHSLIIALGGGVIGDLAGFVAATYMRGIDYIQVPTTILAHDSSVGGKVAINHEQGKNLIGSFYPPSLVLFDTATLATLPTKEIRSGYAELIKEALIADEEWFEKLLSEPLARLNRDSLTEYLKKGIEIKARIIEKDEKELGIRKHLNLGHTLGHALETKLGYGVMTHGEAVAVGLLFAMHVSEAEFKINLPKEKLSRWLEENNYSFNLSIEMIDELIDLMKRDKKVIKQDIQMILLQNLGEPVIHSMDVTKMKDYLATFIAQISKSRK
ncbi:3-dehydroquinate synthase [Ornithinibacillus xuwenensis]|uniref:3-dehydroquinate synthase n=1 Tax=Ornithinibacillus xuwenensis TaxID=3144668 RepID=A0ABU9XH44_9BACI